MREENVEERNLKRVGERSLTRRKKYSNSVRAQDEECEVKTA